MAKIKKQKGYITHKSKNTEDLSVTKIKIKNQKLITTSSYHG